MKNSFNIMLISFLILGTMVGAGILGLPTSAGLAGFFPSTSANFLVMLAMLFSAIVLINEIIKEKQDNLNYPSLYEKHIGIKGKWIAVSANLLILYGVMTAYLSGSTSVISHLTGDPSPFVQKLIMLIIFLILTSLSLTGIQIITRYNALFLILLFASFILLIFLSFEKVQLQRLTNYNDIHFLPASIPVIVSALCFHTIIPSACSSLLYNKRHIIYAVLFALFSALVLNVVWTGVGIGALPLIGEHSIDDAYRHGLPATIPLGEEIDSNLFTYASVAFALVAIITSFIGVAVSLRDFLKDLLENTFNISNPKLILLLTFFPPLIIAIIYPDIFLESIGIVGGIGIVTLFGILPSIIYIKKADKKYKLVFGMIMFLIFCTFLLLEAGKELNLLKIDPRCEYWHVEYNH